MRKLIVVFIAALFIVITGCSTKQPNRVIPKEKVNQIISSGIRDQSQWQEYTNTRFGFSIRFPAAWYKGKGPQNNDGIKLFTDSTNFDIRAYGTHYLEGFSHPYRNLEKEGFKKDDIQLNQGQTAALILGEEDGMKIYEMVYVSEGIEYHFYVKVTAEYAQEYEDLILDVIRTFNPSLEGEDK